MNDSLIALENHRKTIVCKEDKDTNTEEINICKKHFTDLINKKELNTNLIKKRLDINSAISNHIQLGETIEESISKKKII